ncbi:LysR family transcriptional regulator [Pseudomonas sp. Fl4BN1]|uniref:LysR family transcriptional regulator n=1 Tax=Pseudomonas sp. Fl4BN1 TaxID=2697651 RepID=UPI001378DF24|nr:LysR family transcriptional regulator [Pseudomonas sp. Fl4BN1]NBF07847.1 LysR family transcriptional regulator [Pseudomonas sp. Fl4BN1]
MTDKLNGLDIFVCVVEAGSFAQAADKLHLTRSAVGKRIARLEQRLGVQLFHRTTRSQSLTLEGGLFHAHCLRALEEVRAGEALLESGKWQVSGRLRVSMPVLFGHLCIAPILIDMARQHPELILEMSFSDRKVDLMEEGFDLAIRNGALPDSSQLVARRLGEHQMALCASPAYLQRCGVPRTLEALQQHEAVAYMRFGQVLPWQLQVDGQAVAVKPRARLLMDDLRAVADATLAHQGIAWLPYWLARDYLQRGQLQEVLPEHSGIRFEINALRPHAPHLPLKTRVAVDALLEKLPERLALVEARPEPGKA